LKILVEEIYQDKDKDKDKKKVIETVKKIDDLKSKLKKK